MQHRPETAEVVQHRDPHRADVRARIVRRGTPNDDLPGPGARARDTGQVLDDLQHITLSAGNAPRLVGADLRADDLLDELRRHDDDLEVVFVFVRRRSRDRELDAVPRLERASRLDGLLRLERREIRSRQRHGRLAGRQVVEGEPALAVRDGLT